MKFNNVNSQNFQSQAVPEASEIKVNNISLEPIPFVTLTKNEFKSGPYTIGGNLQVGLEGFIYGSSFTQTATGVGNLEAIRTASTSNGYINNISIKCGTTNILENGVGTLDSLNFDQGPQRNWMNVIPYNMQLTVYESGSSGQVIPAVAPNTGIAAKFGLHTGDADKDTRARGISSIQETFNFDFDNALYYMPNNQGSAGDPTTLASVGGKHLRVKFNLNVEGASSLVYHDHRYGTRGLNYVLEKRLKAYLHGDFIDQTIKSSLSFPEAEGIANNNLKTQGYLQTLSYNIDEIGNKVGIQGDLIFLSADNTHKCILTMDIDHSNSIDSAEKSITITGKAIGLSSQAEGIIDESDLTNDFDNAKHMGFLNAMQLDVNKDAIDNAESAIEELFNTDKVQDGAFFRSIRDQAFMDTSSQYGEGTDTQAATTNNSQANTANKGIGEAGYVKTIKADGTVIGSKPTFNQVGTENNKYMVVSKSLKRNLASNTIDFSIKYSNKRFKIAGALWAEISVDHEKPATKIVEHVVPGRGYPLVQDIQCTNLESYTITCTAQKEPQENAMDTITAGADTLIDNQAQALLCNTWAKVQDSCSYGNNGSYRRTVKYTRNFIPVS